MTQLRDEDMDQIHKFRTPTEWTTVFDPRKGSVVHSGYHRVARKGTSYFEGGEAGKWYPARDKEIVREILNLAKLLEER